MEYYFCRKHTLFLMTKMLGLVILKVKSFFSHGIFNSCSALISYLGSKSFVVKNKKNDGKGRILILDVTIDDNDYILVNMYNVNTETDQKGCSPCSRKKYVAKLIKIKKTCKHM